MNNDKTVVFIEDDEIANFLMKRRIKKIAPDVPIKFFENAEGALSFLKNTAQKKDNTRFCILLDIDMPQMSGFDFIESYRQNQLDKALNAEIYILTSSVNHRDRNRSENYPEVSGFFSKPMEAKDLKELVQ